MPIIDTRDAQELDGHLQRFFDSNPSERPHRLRQLFTEKFDFNPATGKVSLAEAPKNVTLPSDAERIASIEGINVVYVPLEIPGTTRVRKAEAAAAARLIAGQVGDDILLLMTNQQADSEIAQLHVILPTFVSSTPALRRMVIERDLPRRTVLQQLSNIYHHWQQKGDLRLALEDAFNVEAVTKSFFKQYREVFELVQGLVKGFPGTDDGREAKKLFVQTLFNRLMFIYFLSRKGWLKFKGDPDYLAVLWKDYRKDKDAKNFYEERLKLLFFTGLNNPRSADLLKENAPLHALIGNVPFLNGGLFDKEVYDEEAGITIPNEAFSAILHDLFDRYNFTVTESTPLDQEVAVDPEMLGKVFEELVTGRHETGSYYTPRPVVSFMCREALKGYLQGAVDSLPAEAIRLFVDQHDVSGLNLASAEKVRKALEQIKVVDPACGSGAYLLGMMHELVELETALYSEKLLMDTKSLYDLKLRIIEENVYGVDIDQFAVNIAMLRLWLSLAIDYESFPPPPLPNLDFKIICGDSLLGPDPSPDNYGTLFRHRVREIASQIADLKGRHLKTTSQEKDSLFSEIESLQGELREVLSDEAVPEEAADWRVEFAEIFNQNGGFDVVVANPPYVSVKALTSTYKDLLSTIYVVGKGRFNLFTLFVERSLTILKKGGILTFIIPEGVYSNVEYRHIRKYILDHAVILLVNLFSDRVFEAAVDTTIISISKNTLQDNSFHVLRDLDDDVIQLKQSFFEDLPYSLFPVNLTPLSLPIVSKLLYPGFDRISSILEIQQGIIYSGLPKGEVFSNSPTSGYHQRVLDGRDVLKWKVNWAEKRENRYILYTDRLHRPREERLFLAKEKILLPRRSTNISCAYDSEQYYALNTAYMCLPINEEYQLKYILSCLNSRLLNYLYSQLFFGWQITIPALNMLPIKKLSMSEQIPFVEIVDRILAVTMAEDYLHDPAKQAIVEEFERQINQLVFRVYCLTQEEIAVVEGN